MHDKQCCTSITCFADLTFPKKCTMKYSVMGCTTFDDINIDDIYYMYIHCN